MTEKEKKMARRVVVTQKPDKEVTVEVLAASIRAIDDGMKQLRAGRLNDRALVILVAHTPACRAEGVGTPAIRAVIDGLNQLAKEYLR